jgi:ubiquinone/menaquinone biosynthesis C-methylase UbiE
MTDYIDRTLRAYDAHPDKFEAATAAMSLGEELTEFAGRISAKDQPVLDVGCAFGRDTAWLAEQGLHTIGIDMSRALLKRAAELHPDLDFRVMDMRELVFEDASIAGIWCNATILHLNAEDMRRALSEFRRVLVAGGIVFVSFKEGEGEEEIVEKFSSDCARYYKYVTESDVRRLIEDAGLQIEKLYRINERERWGPDKRDLNWVNCFARK